MRVYKGEPKTLKRVGKTTKNQNLMSLTIIIKIWKLRVKIEIAL